MTALIEIQRRLQGFVLHPQATPDIGSHVVATPAAGAEVRLEVYAHAYRARLRDVLRNDFPGLLALTAPETFEQLCADYIGAMPSRHPNIRWYGDALAGFLRATPPWAENPALAEMAAFEWTLGLAFDAPTEPGVDAAAFSAIPAADWPTLCLTLKSAVRRLSLRGNVSEIRRTIDRGDECPAYAAWDPPRAWAVWRKGVTVWQRQLDEDEPGALDVLERGGSFAELCQTLCDRHPVEAVAARASLLLQRWVGDEWIRTFSTTPAGAANARNG